MKFLTPSAQGDNRHAPACEPAAVNSSAELERDEDSYRLRYVRGPEGVIIEIAARIG